MQLVIVATEIAYYVCTYDSLYTVGLSRGLGFSLNNIPWVSDLT